VGSGVLVGLGPAVGAAVDVGPGAGNIWQAVTSKIKHSEIIFGHAAKKDGLGLTGFMGIIKN
jgi:hypothetical protein